MSPKADIHNQLQALISSCIDEGDYDPAEDYVKDPFCRRTLHTASLAIEEIDTLRARVAELEAERADYKKLIADELAETFQLFGILGLNTADDFGTKTAIVVVRERIDSIKADRDRWKAIANKRHLLLLDLEWVIDAKDGDGSYCPYCMSMDDEVHVAGCKMAEAIAESARAANGEGKHE